MARISSTLSVNAPGGRSLRASISKQATDIIDQEYILPGGEFVKLFSVDVTGGTSSTKVPNSMTDFKQVVAQNVGNQPIELALETNFVDDADDATHAELVAFPVFNIPVGGFMVIPSPRIHTVTGSAGTPTALNSITNTTQQARLVLPSSSASYIPPGGAYTVGTVRQNMRTDGITNGNGDLNVTNLEAVSGAEGDNGIVPGSFLARFSTLAYQEFDYALLGLKAQTSTTSTLLAANTAYAFQINVDGAGNVNIPFTTHTSDVTWGNPLSGTGVLFKIQTALDTLEVQADIAIVEGNIRFSSRGRVNTAHASVTVSSIAISGPSSGTTILGAGTIPAAAATAVGPANMGNADDIMFDDGEGNLTRKNGGSGAITYGELGDGNSSVGSVYMTGVPANSSVQIAYSYSGTIGGDLASVTPVENEKKCNSVLALYARTVNWATSNFGANGRDGKLRFLVIDNNDYSAI